MTLSPYPILGRIISPQHVLDLSANTRDQAMEALLSSLLPESPERPRVLAELLEREKMASTALGLGVAVPHVRTAHVEDWAIAFARNTQGLEWDSMDGQPVRLIFMLLANQRYALTFVKVISQIVRFVKEGRHRIELLEAPPEQLIEILRRMGQ